jgi:hypothetical protein
MNDEELQRKVYYQMANTQNCLGRRSFPGTKKYSSWEPEDIDISREPG